MKAPTKEWRGHTWLGWLNLILLRWFFVRLGFAVDYEKSFGSTKMYLKWKIFFRVPWVW